MTTTTETLRGLLREYVAETPWGSTVTRASRTPLRYVAVAPILAGEKRGELARERRVNRGILAMLGVIEDPRIRDFVDVLRESRIQQLGKRDREITEALRRLRHLPETHVIGTHVIRWSRWKVLADRAAKHWRTDRPMGAPVHVVKAERSPVPAPRTERRS
jgi:hypothetical protein